MSLRGDVRIFHLFSCSLFCSFSSSMFCSLFSCSLLAILLSFYLSSCKSFFELIYFSSIFITLIHQTKTKSRCFNQPKQKPLIAKIRTITSLLHQNPSEKNGTFDNEKSQMCKATQNNESATNFHIKLRKPLFSVI